MRLKALPDFVRPEPVDAACGVALNKLRRGALARSPKCAPRLRSGRTGLWLLPLTLLVATPAAADSLMPAAEYADTQLPDPRQEAQAKALMETIRCLVCQGQAISDSDAEMAGDMRALIRRRIQAGESPDQVREWLVSRYGNWVTYDPPLEPVTWPLWAAPVLLLIAGLFLARNRFRRRTRKR
jgi:cytochrome c-type biogenesis protein CcmH